jgi:hypothetical protein
MGTTSALYYLSPYEVSLLHEIGVSVFGVFQRSTPLVLLDYPINSTMWKFRSNLWFSDQMVGFFGMMH